jgi:G:T-mismatch repair DNA endonuclease (very short patch repair protein)
MRHLGYRVLVVWQCELRVEARVTRRLQALLKGSRNQVVAPSLRTGHETRRRARTNG